MIEEPFRSADLNASIPMLDEPWRLYRFEKMDGVDSVIVGLDAHVEAPVILIGNLATEDFRKVRV